MRWVLVISLMLAVVPGLAAPGLAQTIGIVLMHGKTGSPTSVINQLAIALQGAGYLVEAPEMCWSRRRIYDRPFLDCLTEIDSAIGRLKSRGAGRMVVAGMSQGGDAALVYGARHANLAGTSRSLQPRHRSGKSGCPTSRKALLRLARWSPPAAATSPPALWIATPAARSPSGPRQRFI